MLSPEIAPTLPARTSRPEEDEAGGPTEPARGPTLPVRTSGVVRLAEEEEREPLPPSSPSPTEIRRSGIRPSVDEEEDLTRGRTEALALEGSCRAIGLIRLALGSFDVVVAVAAKGFNGSAVGVEWEERERESVDGVDLSGSVGGGGGGGGGGRTLAEKEATRFAWDKVKLSRNRCKPVCLWRQ